MGMGTGLAEPEALSTFHQGVPTAAELLQSLVNMNVVAAPGKVWIYNNTVYSVGAYLPLLASGVKPADLAAAYTVAMQERVFGPAGMASTLIADDPRGRVANFSRGHGLDAFGRTGTLPYGAVGSYAPVGGGLSTLNDMANYLRLELRRGKSVTGSESSRRRISRNAGFPVRRCRSMPATTPTVSAPDTGWAGSASVTRTAARWSGTTGRSTASPRSSASCPSATSDSWC